MEAKDFLSPAGAVMNCFRHKWGCSQLLMLQLASVSVPLLLVATKISLGLIEEEEEEEVCWSVGRLQIVWLLLGTENY